MWKRKDMTSPALGQNFCILLSMGIHPCTYKYVHVHIYIVSIACSLSKIWFCNTCVRGPQGKLGDPTYIQGVSGFRGNMRWYFGTFAALAIPIANCLKSATQAARMQEPWIIIGARRFAALDAQIKASRGRQRDWGPERASHALGDLGPRTQIHEVGIRTNPF